MSEKRIWLATSVLCHCRFIENWGSWGEGYKVRENERGGGEDKEETKLVTMFSLLPKSAANENFERIWDLCKKIFFFNASVMLCTKDNVNKV